MNKKFPMTNYRGLTYIIILTCILLGATSLCTVFLFSGRGILWFIPAVICFFLLIIDIMGLLTVISIGIDLKDDVVWLPDPNMPRRSIPAFNLDQLEDIHLETQNGEIVSMESDNYAGCRIIFSLKDDESQQYYPMILNKRQYKNLYNGLMSARR